MRAGLITTFPVLTAAVALPQKKERATLDQVGYVGNVGTPWGSNIRLSDATASSTPYAARFVSTGGEFTCSCFNKIGPDGGINGAWSSAVVLSVDVNDVWVEFDADSQGACACSAGDSVEVTQWGMKAGTWLEFDMGSVPNGGNSGADVSVLVAGASGMPYIGMSVAANGNLCSWVKSSGENMDAYMPGMEDLDGVGCKGYTTSSLEVRLGDNF